MPKRAKLVADAVSILCPSCGEPQPNGNDGSEQWTQTDVRRELEGLRNGILKCASCAQAFRIVPSARVLFQ